ncbi:MAG: filamentous hemagglutinin N-terminal domain-containing protein [Nostoc sp.]|uniref:two-partner secretion domain-containing protein n=1 Tax=Nostoc sp. TaxID=1180 RepID=UPI002FFA33C6
MLAHVIFCCENHALAQITPDGTLGNNSSKVTRNVNIKGSAADRIDGGATRGANLFHSFQEFNVGELQRVYFANPTGISNILTRVTGSNISNILGTLGVDGGANLFLINPNGILFGNNARLDVAGSFVGSTANSFVFGNSLEFSATNPQTPSPLLTVNPSALLFNQITAAPIQNNSVAPAGIDPAGFNAFGLRVGDGKSLLLVGGNISMDGGQLNAYGGRAELGGLAAPGNVNLLFNGDNLSLKFPENVTRASVSLTNQAVIYVEGAGDGDIAINARNLEILGGSRLSAGIGVGLGTPEIVAGDITLNATGEIKIAGSKSGIRNFVGEGAKGKGGNITIDSGKFSLRDGAQLGASTSGVGNAGNVTVGAKNAVSLADNAYIFSTVEAGGVGKAGNIDINATSLSLTNGAQLLASTYGQGNAGNVTVGAKNAVSLVDNAYIFSTVEAGGVGKAGNIDINATSLSLTNGAQLLTSTRSASDTKPAGQGNAGNVNVKVTGAVDIAGEKNGLKSAILSAVGTGTVGNGGNIFIYSANFSLRDGAQLSASTYGQGNAGNVNVKVTGAVDIAGEKNGLKSAILSSVASGAAGNGGDINIKAKTFSLTDGAALITSIFGKGNAGSVFVQASGRVSLASGSYISSNVIGVGTGGDINITADSLSLTDGAALFTATLGQGNAGNVTIKADGAVSVDGVRVIDGFPIASGAYSGVIPVATLGSVGIGNGGDINITAGSFSLTNGAQLNTVTGGQGNAGNVIIKTDGAVLLDGAGEISGISVPSSVYSGVGGFSASQFFEAFGFLGLGLVPDRGILGNGKGGNINITAGSLSLTNGAQLETSTSGQGNAGSVFVQAKDSVYLAGSGTGILSNVFSEAVGKGGEIDITAGSLFLTNGAALISSTRGQGNAGNVFVQTKDSVSLAGSGTHIFTTVNRGGVGKGGDIDISSRSFSVTGGAELAASTEGRGNAGNILVNATDSVELSGVASFPVLEDGRAGGFSSGLFTTTNKGASGQGGELGVTTGILRVSDGAVLSARSQSGSKGGNITVNANVLEVINGGQFLTTAFNSGDAGNIAVKVKDRITISGSDSTFSDRFNSVAKVFGEEQAKATIDPVRPEAGLFANTATGSSGNGGSIFIDPMRLAIADGAGIAVDSQGIGKGGSLQVQAGSLTLDNKAFLSAIANTGQGGDIALTVQDLLLLRRNSQISTTAGNRQFGGNGGNITINTPFIVAVPQENSDITANAFTGIGGKVDITTNGIFGLVPQKSPTKKSDITASSEFGVSGEVTINSPDTDPSRGLIQLPSNLVDASQQIAQGCTPRRGQNASRFIATGRGGLPQSPNEPLRGRAVITGWVDLPTQVTHTVINKSSTASMTKSTDRIVEAQGWIVDGNGNIMLVAQSVQSSFIPSAMSCGQ